MHLTGQKNGGGGKEVTAFPTVLRQYYSIIYLTFTSIHLKIWRKEKKKSGVRNDIQSKLLKDNLKSNLQLDNTIINPCTTVYTGIHTEG